MSLRPHHDPSTATPARRSLVILPFSERQQALSRAGLPALTLLDALDRDHRPTFAIHSQPQTDTSQPPNHGLPEVVYCNPALTAADDLLAKVAGKNNPSISYASFLSWLIHDAATTHVFEGHIWSILAIDQPRVKIVSGVPNLGPRDGEELGSDNDGLDTGHERKRKRAKHELGGLPGSGHVSDDCNMEKRDRAQILMEDSGPEGQHDAPYDVDWSKLKNVPLSTAPTRRSSYDGQAHLPLNLPPTPSPSVSSRSLTLLETTKFQRFAERADIAIYIIDPLTRRYTYRNQRWFDIFKINLEDDDDDDVWKSWTRIVLPENMAECEELFKRLTIDKQALSVEIKTNIPWQPPSSSPTSLSPSTPSPEHVKWILCSAYPELNQNADIVEIVGNVTDISKQKWAEGIQKQRVESALESKKHLELFIDSTSHEMRNPLSAIMQCADEIVSSFTGTHTQALQEAEREQTLDAAKTITQCAQHMKRIVDDILTISKLDSGLLVFTPIDAQPAGVARHAVKMFEAEAKAANVNMNVVVDKSLRDENAEWVRLDTTRLLQVLINLITNAIKFTRLENTRHIILSVGASSSRRDGASSEYSSEVGWLKDGQRQPMNEMDDQSKVCEQIFTPSVLPFSNVQFIPSSLPPDANLEADWQLGDTVNIHFSVQDSGRGLSEEEQRNLFARFSQASPRTHINYGGSGLGLFISKRLCQMHGGQIGLSSKEGKGSTFSFYIKARRTTADSTARNNSPAVFPEDLGYTPSTGADVSGSRTPPQPSVLDADLQTLHVLIVEDNIVNQKVLAKQLRNLGHVVWTANHGGEALEFLEKTNAWKCDNGHENFPNLSSNPHDLNPVNSVQGGSDTQCDNRKGEPGIDFTSKASRAESQQKKSLPLDLDLILLDWEMPVMDGITCVRQIRALQNPSSTQNTFVSQSANFSTTSLSTSAPRSPQVGGGTPWLIKHIPVIGVTANARKQQIDEALEAGMDDVVSKPFRVGELVDRMRGVLQRCIGSMRDGDGSRHSREGIEFQGGH